MITAFLRGLESMFAWLIEASWQASVLVALVLLLQLMLRSRLNPRWHHALWLLVLARLLLPFLPECALSLFQFAPTPPPVVTESVTEPIFQAPPAVMVVGLTPGPASAATYPFSVFTVLALVWLTGAVALLILTWRVNRRFARHVVAVPLVDDPRLLKLAEATQQELGLHRRLRIIESVQVQSPAIMGLFRPTLILPKDVRTRFDDDELRFIFLHEFAHLKRGDLFLQWLVALLQILHWFNPVLWYAFRRMRADREPATDALVLSCTGEAYKESYGQVLVKLLEHYHARHSLPTLVGILEDKDQFKRRFSLISKFTRGAYGWSMLAAALIGVLAVVCLTKSKSAVSPNDTKATLAKTSPEQAKPSGEQLIDATAREDIPEMTRLLKLGTDVNYRGKDDWTPITKAAASNKVQSVKFLLAHGADPNSIKSPGWNYSGMSLTNKPEIADALLAAGGNINAILFDRGVPIIDMCVDNGAPEMLNWFIAHGVDPAKARGDHPDQTLLFDAGSPEIAEILIQHGVDVNARSKDGQTALDNICIFHRHSAEIARVLLAHGANPNARDNSGATPLSFAPDGATVDLLVEHGADIKAAGDTIFRTTMTPKEEPGRLKALIAHGVAFDLKTNGPKLMMSAAWRGHVDTVAYLLSLGVDPNQKAQWGDKKYNDFMTPMEAAVTDGQYDAAKVLVEHGAKIESLDVNNALYNRRKDIMKLFWEHGARTVSELTYDISQGAPVIDVQKLLDAGMPADPPQDADITPLTLAAELGRLDIVTLLLQHGAKLELPPVQSKPRMQPLEGAAMEGQDEIVDALLHHGAKVDNETFFNAAWNVNPYNDQRNKDHFEKTLKLLIDSGALNNLSAEQKGRILDAVIDTRNPGGNATALKMLLDAGLSPELPLTDFQGAKLGSVIAHFREWRVKNPEDDFHLYPLIDMLEAADKGAAPKADAATGQDSHEDLATLKKDLLAAQEDADARRVLVNSVKDLPDDQFLATIAALGRSDSNITALQSDIEIKNAEIKGLLKSGFTEDHPRVQALRAELAAKQEQLKPLVAGVRRAMNIDCQMADSRVTALTKELAEAHQSGAPIGVIAPPGKSSAAQELDDLKQKLLQAKEDADARRVLVNSVKDLADDQLLAALAGLGRSDPTITALQKEIADKNADIAGLLKSGFTEDHPRVVAQRAELASLQQELKRLTDGLHRAMIVDNQMADSRVSLLQEEVDNLKAQTSPP